MMRLFTFLQVLNAERHNSVAILTDDPTPKIYTVDSAK